MFIIEQFEQLRTSFMHLWQIRPTSSTLQWYKTFFFLRGEILYTPSERREKRREDLGTGKTQLHLVQAAH